MTLVVVKRETHTRREAARAATIDERIENDEGHHRTKDGAITTVAILRPGGIVGAVVRDGDIRRRTPNDDVVVVAPPPRVVVVDGAAARGRRRGYRIAVTAEHEEEGPANAPALPRGGMLEATANTFPRSHPPRR